MGPIENKVQHPQALVDSAPGHQDSKRELLALLFHFSLPKSSYGVSTLLLACMVRATALIRQSGFSHSASRLGYLVHEMSFKRTVMDRGFVIPHQPLQLNKK
jgi:hypothetical protein